MCRQCPRLSRTADDSIECTPPPSSASMSDPFVVRLGGDACVGDAMGGLAVAVHQNVAAGVVARSLGEEGAAVALVVDDEGRLVGLIDSAEIARMVGGVRAGQVARWVGPVHEAAPLDHAIDRMVRERARALPVVDDAGCVVALLTDLDALRWVAHRGGTVE